MPATKRLAGMARSYTSEIFVNRGLTCDYQWTVRRQPCGDLRVRRAILDLGCHRRTAIRPHPHQAVAAQPGLFRHEWLRGFRHWLTHD